MPTDTTKRVAGTFLDNIDWKNFVAGTAGGAFSTALFHPLDLIKIRWQVYENATLKLIKTTSKNTKVSIDRPAYKSLSDTFSSIYKSENGVRGLYRGVIINTLASGSAWGIYFFLYNGLKNYHKSSSIEVSDKNISATSLTMYATLASVTTIGITNPLFLIKTRMCLQYTANPSNTVKVVKYKNSLDAFLVLFRAEGLRGMYKGIVPGLFGTLNGTIQMVCYEKLKIYWLDRLERQVKQNGQTTAPKLDTSHFSVFSSMSKVLAVVCTYPFQLVRSRLQDQHQNYKSVRDVITTTYRNERFYGFYKGLIPGLVRVVPAATVTFIVYENLLEFLKLH